MALTSANVQTVDLIDGRQVCLSYGVVVAAFIPVGFILGPGIKTPRGYVKTDRRHSVTTSRHANAFAGPEATVVPDEILQSLVLPVVGRRT